MMINYSFVSDGCCLASHCFIGGGRENVIGHANINAWQDHSVIGGGQLNCIEGVNNNPDRASWSFIGGGCENVIRSEFSTIAGGAGNTIPVNFPNTHIVGSGIVVGGAVGNAGSLHIN